MVTATLACSSSGGESDGGNGITDPPPVRTPTATILRPDMNHGCVEGEGCECEAELKDIGDSSRGRFIIDDTLGTTSGIFCGHLNVAGIDPEKRHLAWGGTKSPVLLEAGMHVLYLEAFNVFNGSILVADTTDFLVEAAPPESVIEVSRPQQDERIESGDPVRCDVDLKLPALFTFELQFDDEPIECVPDLGGPPNDVRIFFLGTSNPISFIIPSLGSHTITIVVRRRSSREIAFELVRRIQVIP